MVVLITPSRVGFQGLFSFRGRHVRLYAIRYTILGMGGVALATRGNCAQVPVGQGICVNGWILAAGTNVHSFGHWVRPEPAATGREVNARLRPQLGRNRPVALDPMSEGGLPSPL